MGFDYIQIQTEASYFDFDESIFTERAVVASAADDDGYSALPKAGLDARKLVLERGLPPSITDKLKIEITAGVYVTLGLPATLLGEDYFDLINANNFDRCLQSLADYGLVRSIDIDGVKQNSRVVRLDNTCDVIVSRTPKKTDFYHFRRFLKNAYRWKRIKPLVNSFGSAKNKENFKIYGKTREMNRAHHRVFKAAFNLDNLDKLVRIEHRLNSAEKVKQHFGSKRLEDVLNSKGDVLTKFLETAFVKIDPSVLYKKKDSKPFNDRLAVAVKNGFDPDRIQNAAREWGKHKAVRLRDINQAIIATEKQVQRSGDLLKEIIDLQATTRN